MRPTRRLLGVGSLTAVVAAAVLASPAWPRRRLAGSRPGLPGRAAGRTDRAATTVLVHGTDIAAARAAVAATGMRLVTEFERIGVVVAVRYGRPDPGGAGPARRHLPRGQQPDRVLRRDVEHRDPRRRRRPQP